MENCEFIIQCNPYDKTINYKRRDEKKEWQPIVTSSRLANYQKGAIQNYADAIIKEAVQATYIEPGKPAYFQGTRTDYDDFIKKLAYLQETELYQGIEIIFDENNKLPEAHKAISVIENAYKEIASEMKEYYTSPDDKNEFEREETIKEHLQKYKEITKPELIICVIGSYSTGKSTFINALVGEELLPSKADPTTARVVRIRNGQQNQISFKYDKFEFTMKWKGDIVEYSPLEGTSGIIDKLNEAITGKSSVVSQMNAVIALLNKQYEKDGQITDKVLAEIGNVINLVFKYNNSVLGDDEFAYVIIDSPGSNSATYGEKHGKVLEDLLADQTNSLPVLIVDRNSLDSKDNKEIDEMLNEIGGSIDYAHKLVVINKADDITLDTLNKQISPEIMETKRFARLFYVSSIIALGSRKNGSELLDGSYREIFDTRRVHFSRNDEYLRELYRYAILPGDEKEQSEKESIKYATNEERLLVANSGIYALEYEIKKFARKYLYYLKAKEARKHLLEAFDLMDNELKQAKQGLDNELKDYQKQRKAKKDELVQKIKNAMILSFMIEDIRKETIDRYDNDKNDFITKQLRPQIKYIHNNIKKRDDLTNEEANQSFHRQMVNFCNGFYHEKFPIISTFIKKELTREANKYINKITGIIETDKDPTNAAKKRIMDFTIPMPAFDADFTSFADTGAFPKRFLLFGQPTIRPGAYYKRMKIEFDFSFKKDIIDKPFEQMKKELTDWLDETEKKLIENIDTTNLDLKEWDKRISTQMSSINDLEGRISRLSKPKQELSELFTFKSNVKKNLIGR